MKKYLLAGLIVVGTMAYGTADGQVSGEVGAAAKVLSNLRITQPSDASTGGVVYFGTLFQGDTKNTWQGKSLNGANPAKPVIEATGQAGGTVTLTNGNTITYSTTDVSSSAIEYTFPQFVLLTKVGAGQTPAANQEMTADIYDGTLANDDTTDPTGAGKGQAQGQGSMVAATWAGATALDGQYPLRIHGEITAGAAQETGDYTGTFTLTAKYSSTIVWN